MLERMRRWGVTYDTGFIHEGTTTRERFEPRIVGRELRIIHDDLGCDAVRVTGGDRDRLALAARLATEAGLEVWYCPFTCDVGETELLDFLADAAERAERLRGTGADVVLVTGSEIGVFVPGFLPGGTLDERLAVLARPETLRTSLPKLRTCVNAFLDRAVAIVRERFGGAVTYASLPFEGVDWAPFDIVSTDAAYGSPADPDRFRAGIRALSASGKPVAITEFGCPTYRGASGPDGHGDRIVEWEEGHAVRLDGEYGRAEDEQAACLLTLLDLFDAELVDTAFVNTFVRYDLPHRPDAREDLDLASYGIVKVLEDDLGKWYPDMPWEPKAAFLALVGRRRMQRPTSAPAR